MISLFVTPTTPFTDSAEEEGEPSQGGGAAAGEEEDDSSAPRKKKKKKKKRKGLAMGDLVEGREEVPLDGIPADIINEKGRYECKVCIKGQ